MPGTDASLALRDVLRRHADGSLDEIARRVGVSYTTASHLFTREMGLPFRTYRHWVMCMRAAEEFRGQRKLTDIAQRAGFADSAHLSRSWQRRFGFSPSICATGAASESSTEPARAAQALRLACTRCTRPAHPSPESVRCFTKPHAPPAEKRRREEADMRNGILALGFAFAIALCHGWLQERATGAGLSDEARAAIDIRCQGRDGRAGRECRELLEKLYLAGTLDPEKTLRDHCTPAKMVAWGARAQAPPVCRERYGGWQKG